MAVKLIYVFHRDESISLLLSFQKLGFSDGDISKEPKILTLRFQTIMSRYRIYTDYRFTKSVIDLTLLRRYVKTQRFSIHELKRVGYIDKYKQVLTHINEKYKIEVGNLSESMPLESVHRECLMQYLALTLCMSIDEARYDLKKYPNLRCRSFKCIDENVRVLMQKFGFTHEKVRGNIFGFIRSCMIIVQSLLIGVHRTATEINRHLCMLLYLLCVICPNFALLSKIQRLIINF